MTTLAGAGKIAGELTVTGKVSNGETPSVSVNGEAAKSGRSVFSTSTIATPDEAGAVIDLGKIGSVQLAPKTNLVLSFTEKGISGDLLAGSVTVLNAANSVNVTTVGGKTFKLNAGETATASGQQTQDTDDDGGGAAVIPYVLILGGAAAAIVIAAGIIGGDNETQLGGGTIVVSANR
ncbi:MAG TPA: hypothetical protein VF692_08220 [Pyrinomonadaceae bacterium]